jgi:hypothetical protein
MDHATLRRTRRFVLAGILVGGLLCMQAAPAFAQDGVEVKGPEIEFIADIVVQPTIQVDASMPWGGDNTQTAGSNSDFDQSADADSGDPDASNGGTAVTGAAVAGSLNVSVQTTVQVIAGLTPEDGVQQESWNEAGGELASGAYVGDADADGLGSAAVSGSAVAWGNNIVEQTSVAVWSGWSDD